MTSIEFKRSKVTMLLLVLACMVLPLGAEKCPISASSDATDSQVKVLQDSQMEVAVNLLHIVASQKPSKNVFLSPSSIYAALLLEFFASAGNTTTSLRKILHLPQNMTKSVVAGLYIKERDKLKNSTKANINKYELESANRIYVHEDVAIRKCVQLLFQDEFKKINFKDGTAIKKINSWVAEVTKNMINPFLPKGLLEESERIALVNAVYFKGNWKTKFDADNTNPGKFTLADGTTKEVEMMSNTAEFTTLYNGNKYGVLQLPYEGNDIVMLIVLPIQPSLKAIPKLLNMLTHKELDKLLARISKEDQAEVTISLPKFTSEQSYELVPVLKKMGAGELFDRPADLSALIESKSSIPLSKVFHKAKIEVDELGTKAAAATLSIGFRALSADFNVDRPFIYFIYQKSSRTIHFAGIFNSP